MIRLLLVEDDITIQKALSYLLKQSGYEVHCAGSIGEAEKLVSIADIIILDVTLPDGNGFDFYSVSVKGKDIPTMFLTARDDEEDIVRGLESGADDYLTKPFFNKELLARISKMARQIEKSNRKEAGGVVFDFDSMQVFEDGKQVDFTYLETQILMLLFENMNRAISRDRLCDYVFDWTGNSVNENSITVYMNRIRKKLKHNIVVTVKGIGYRIDKA